MYIEYEYVFFSPAAALDYSIYIYIRAGIIRSEYAYFLTLVLVRNLTFSALFSEMVSSAACKVKPISAMTGSRRYARMYQYPCATV